jgi:hypothetical protein
MDKHHVAHLIMLAVAIAVGVYLLFFAPPRPGLIVVAGVSRRLRQYDPGRSWPALAASRGAQEPRLRTQSAQTSMAMYRPNGPRPLRLRLIRAVVRNFPQTLTPGAHKSSHVPMLSQPGVVIEVIRKAAAAVQKV